MNTQHELLDNGKKLGNTKQPEISDSLINFDFNFDNYDSVVDNYLLSKNVKVNPKRILTRGQERNIKNIIDIPEKIIEKYIKIFKILRDNDSNKSENLFLCDRYRKTPKIDIQIFPFIYQFIAKTYNLPINTEFFSDLLLQLRIFNLIYMLLMADDPIRNTSSRYKINKNAFLGPNSDEIIIDENIKLSNMKQKELLVTETKKSIDKKQIDMDVMNKFNIFCQERVINLYIIF